MDRGLRMQFSGRAVIQHAQGFMDGTEVEAKAAWTQYI